MNVSRRRIVPFVVLTVAIPVAYYAGGVHGFGKGYGAAIYSRSGEARTTVGILQRLRSGDTKAATDMLEIQLDSLLVDSSVGWEAYRSVFNLPRLVGVGSEALVDQNAAPAVAYRAQFPPSPSSSSKAVVDGAIAQLAKRLGKGMLSNRGQE
jgi:hypothetical protein